MKLLILGGIKFIGKSLIDLAIKQNHAITLISLDDPGHKDKLEWININRNNLAELTFALSGKQFDAVIDNIAYRPQQVKDLLKALDGRAARYVLTSSVDIYTNSELKVIDEINDENLTPIQYATGTNAYLSGKRECEVALRSDVTIQEKVIIRPCIVTGPNDNINIANTGTPRSLWYAARAINNYPIFIHREYNHVFSLVHSDDVASALLIAAQHPDATDRIFNVRGDTSWTLESYANALIRICNSNSKIVKSFNDELAANGVLAAGEKIITPYMNGINQFSLFDTSKIKELGWAPMSDDQMLKSLTENTDALTKTLESHRNLIQKECDYAASLISESEPDLILGHFSGVNSLISIGTHRGDQSVDTNSLYHSAIKECLSNGINTIDTAVTYRNEESEKTIGNAIRECIDGGTVTRNDICVITKGGFLPVPEKRMVGTTPHENSFGSTIRPSYIQFMLNQSRKNLQLSTIDIYLLHNPENCLKYLSSRQFYETIFLTFKMLEVQVSIGNIREYGIATWTGLFVSEMDQCYIDLNKILKCAELAGGKHTHHFTTLELPFNLSNNSAYSKKSQTIDGTPVSVFEYAKYKNLKVFTSNSAMYGNANNVILSHVIPDSSHLSATQKLLKLNKSMMYTTSAIVGMKGATHVSDAIAVLSEIDFNEDSISGILDAFKFKRLS